MDYKGGRRAAHDPASVHLAVCQLSSSTRHRHRRLSVCPARGITVSGIRLHHDGMSPANTLKMQRLLIVLVVLGLTSVVSAKPAFLPLPFTYATPITPGTQIITNGGTLDRQPEVAAVAETREAVVGERVNPADVRSPRRRQSSLRIDDQVPTTVSTSPAPLGVDGRVVDTAEVAIAKAAHAAAHANERLKLAREAARSGALPISDLRGEIAEHRSTVIGDTPEVAAARTAHVSETIDLANEIAVTSGAPDARLQDGTVLPLVLGNGVIALVPLDVDGRLLDTPEVAAVRGDWSPLSNAAVTGPALAYGRLVY